MEVRFLLSQSPETPQISPSPRTSSIAKPSPSSSRPSFSTSSSSFSSFSLIQPSPPSSSSPSPSSSQPSSPFQPFSLPSARDSFPSSSPPTSFPFPPLIRTGSPTSHSPILASSPISSPPPLPPTSPSALGTSGQSPSFTMFPSFTTSWGSPPNTTTTLPSSFRFVSPPSNSSPPATPPTIPTDPRRIQFTSPSSSPPTNSSGTRPLSCGPSPNGNSLSEWQQLPQGQGPSLASPTNDHLLNLLANAALAPGQSENEHSPRDQQPQQTQQLQQPQQQESGSPPLSKSGGHEIRLVTYPPGGELVARKTLKFSVMMTGDDGRLNGNIYIAVVLIEAKTLIPVSDGLIEKKPKPRKDTPGPRPPQDIIIQRIVPYREAALEFQIVKGSAKKNIQNRLRFELRLYKKGAAVKNNSSYTILDTDHSPLYRILTHSSQLGRAK